MEAAWNRIGDDWEVLGLPFTCIQMYVKKLTRFEAWKRMGEIKMHIVDDFVENKRVEFSLEELHDEPLPEVTVGNFSSGGDASPSTKGTDVFLLDWTEPTPIMEEEQLNPQTERPPTPAEVAASRGCVGGDAAEEELNAPEEPPHNGGTDSDDLDGWSSPTIPSTDDDVGNHLDGQYNPYTSSEDSMYVEEQNYRSSSSSYQADESADESSESESVNQEASAENRWEREYDETNNEAGNSDPVDRQRPEVELLDKRGWGSEEDVALGPDRYPMFNPARDLDAAEIVIGREFESFAHFKDFCKMHAIRSRRGVKFPVNDNIRCRRNIQSWCKYFFDTSTISEHNLNNHCESFNKWILDAREMPILSCLETIRFKMMKRIQENYVGMGSRDPESLCPNAYDVMKERKKVAFQCYPTFSGDSMYEVREGLKSWVVNLRGSKCACGLWQLSGLPCQHALSCITLNNEPVEPYCNPCFKVSSYKLAYRNAIYPLNDSSQWPNSLGPTLRAPTIETPRSGVKQKKRRREHGEVLQRKDKNGKTYSTVRKAGNGQRCTVCKKTGHNRRAHSSTDVTGSGVASTSATPATAQAAPEEAGASQQVVHDRAYVRVTRSKLNVSRGGRTG
ncbi:hypothetical protein LINPERHAP2_LOCUS25968 [Linum perenne]